MGPWTLTEKIYTRRDAGVSIYATTDPDWVVKVYEITNGTSVDHAYDELHTIIELQSNKIPHRVEVPVEPHRFFGTRPGVIWYAMRRYSSSVVIDPEARAHWRSIAVSVLTFLQYFHTRCRKVHMDLKCGNILVDRGRMRFVVSDYDLAGPVRPDKVASQYTPNTYWYYAAMGAELNEPLNSWRMDLTALGYMLAAITWNTEENNRWKFYDECLLRRDDKHGLEISDEDLIRMREEEMSRIHLTVRTYLNMVAAQVPWSAADPPPREFYNRLMALFH